MTSEQSTVRPDGWVGDPAELERARRYRAAIKWGTGPFWLLLIAYWVVIFAVDSPVLQGLILLVVVFWAVLNVYMHRRISQIIGRKWSYRLEQKERQRQDDPWQQGDDEANPVGDWLGAPVRPGTGGLEPRSREATAEGSDGVSGADSTADDALATQPDGDAAIAASPADSHVPAAYRSSDRVAKPSRARNAIWMAAALLGMFAVVGLVLVTVLSSASTTAAQDLAIGDCFDDPESDEFATIDTVSCDEPHDNEVFAIKSVGTDLGPDYPGQSEMEVFGTSACLEDFDGDGWGIDRVPTLLVAFLSPTSESWADSDRTITCFFYLPDLQKKMTGSMRATSADTTVPEDAPVAPASTTTPPGDVTVDTEPADATVDTEPAGVIIKVAFNVGSEGLFTTDPSGPICPNGSMTDEPGPGERSGQRIILEAVNVFTCEDGSGTFTVKLSVILDPDFTTTYDWIVTNGTGDYTRLHGQGEGVGTPIDFPLKSGVFIGEMHID